MAMTDLAKAPVKLSPWQKVLASGFDAMRWRRPCAPMPKAPPGFAKELEAMRVRVAGELSDAEALAREHGVHVR